LKLEVIHYCHGQCAGQHSDGLQFCGIGAALGTDGRKIGMNCFRTENNPELGSFDSMSDW
jgi:hypothetical protein